MLSASAAADVASQLEGDSGLVRKFEQLCQHQLVFNSSVQQDKETFGAGLPVHQLRLKTFREAVESVLSE
jgi:hypothetical protein